MCSLSAAFMSSNVNTEARPQGRQDWMFENGSLRRTRRLATTLRVGLTIMYRPCGSSEAIYSRIGCQMVLFFGSTENVRSYHNSAPQTPDGFPIDVLAGSGKTILWFVIPRFNCCLR
jgi:hypothetical protein